MIRRAEITDLAGIKQAAVSLGYNRQTDEPVENQLKIILDSENDKLFVYDEGEVKGWIHFFISNRVTSSPFIEIGALSRMIQTMSDLSFKSFNLQKGQFMFITRVCENPGINHIQLTQMMYIDKGTTTKAVQKLIKLGYIEKRQDQTDSRVQRLYPTELAKEIYTKLIEREEFYIKNTFFNFSEEEQEVVTKLVKKMRSNIESVWVEERSGRDR